MKDQTIVIEDSFEKSNVEPSLKRLKVEIPDIKSEDEIEQTPSLQGSIEIENLFQRAYDSFLIIKYEKIKENYETDDSDATEVIKTLQDEFEEFEELDTIQTQQSETKTTTPPRTSDEIPHTDVKHHTNK